MIGHLNSQAGRKRKKNWRQKKKKKLMIGTSNGPTGRKRKKNWRQKKRK